MFLQDFPGFQGPVRTLAAVVLVVFVTVFYCWYLTTVTSFKWTISVSRPLFWTLTERLRAVVTLDSLRWIHCVGYVVHSFCVRKAEKSLLVLYNIFFSLINNYYSL